MSGFLTGAVASLGPVIAEYFKFYHQVKNAQFVFVFLISEMVFRIAQATAEEMMYRALS